MTVTEVLALPDKRCTQCDHSKSRSSFFIRIRKGYATSHSECKECTKLTKKRWAHEHGPYTREYARQYYTTNTDACQERHRQWSKKTAGTDIYKRYWNKHKASARKAVQYALKMGTLMRQPCAECGGKNVEAHHPNYHNKLDVVWLCKKHHGFLSRKA